MATAKKWKKNYIFLQTPSPEQEKNGIVFFVKDRFNLLAYLKKNKEADAKHQFTLFNAKDKTVIISFDSRQLVEDFIKKPETQEFLIKQAHTARIEKKISEREKEIETLKTKLQEVNSSNVKPQNSVKP